MQVVAHTLNEVGKEAVRRLHHLLCPGLLYDVCLDLHRSHIGSEGCIFNGRTRRAAGEAELTKCGF